MHCHIHEETTDRYITTLFTFSFVPFHFMSHLHLGLICLLLIEGHKLLIIFRFRRLPLTFSKAAFSSFQIRLFIVSKFFFLYFSFLLIFAELILSLGLGLDLSFIHILLRSFRTNSRILSLWVVQQ